MRELIGRSEESAIISSGTRECAPSARQNRPSPAASSGGVLALQSTVGNRALTGLLGRPDTASYEGWEQVGVGARSRTRLEASFGENFSDVRIRPDLDPRIAPYGARACVEGSVIRVDPRLANSGDETVRVVAHELAHIVQGRRGIIRADAFDRPVGRDLSGARGDHAVRVRCDKEAEMAGDRATRGQATPIRAGSVVPQTQTLDWPSLDEMAETSLLTATLGPVLGPVVAATSDEKDRKEFLDKSKKVVSATIDDLEDRATQQDEELVSQVGDTPVLGTLARANAKVAKFQREVAGGFLKAGTETVLGVAGLTSTPVESAKGIAELGHKVNQLSPGSAVTDIAADAITGTPIGEATKDAVARRGETALGLVNAFTEGYQEAWRDRRYGQIPGRLAFEALSLLIPGDEAGKLGQATKLGGKTRLLGKADDLSNVGRAAGKGKTPPPRAPATVSPPKPKAPTPKPKAPAVKPKAPAVKPKAPAAKPKSPREPASAADADLTFDLHVGKKTARKLQTGEENLTDVAATFDIDEVLPVGARGIERQPAIQRALDPHNRQLLDPMTNRRTKGLGIDPRDIERSRRHKAPVSLDDKPDALVGDYRFDEIVEMREVFDEAVSSIDVGSFNKPTALKNAINRKIRYIITNGKSPAAVKVRRALASLGFELVPDRGWTLVRE